MFGTFDEGHPDGVTAVEVNDWRKSTGVQFMGWSDEIKSGLDDCSVFVLPSYREGLPRSVLEAMAVGRAIVTTDVPGCRETVKNGVNGYLVPAGDSHELMKAMECFLQDPALIGAMGRSSRELCEASFESRSIARSIIATIHSASED